MNINNMNRVIAVMIAYVNRCDSTRSTEHVSSSQVERFIKTVRQTFDDAVCRGAINSKFKQQFISLLMSFTMEISISGLLNKDYFFYYYSILLFAKMILFLSLEQTKLLLQLRNGFHENAYKKTSIIS